MLIFGGFYQKTFRSFNPSHLSLRLTVPLFIFKKNERRNGHTLKPARAPPGSSQVRGQRGRRWTPRDIYMPPSHSRFSPICLPTFPRALQDAYVSPSHHPCTRLLPHCMNGKLAVFQTRLPYSILHPKLHIHFRFKKKICLYTYFYQVSELVSLSGSQSLTSSTR